MREKFDKHDIHTKVISSDDEYEKSHPHRTNAIHHDVHSLCFNKDWKDSEEYLIVYVLSIQAFCSTFYLFVFRFQITQVFRRLMRFYPFVILSNSLCEMLMISVPSEMSVPNRTANH